MKKNLKYAIALFCCLSSSIICAQNPADAYMKQAQHSLAEKEYTKSRSLFLEAYRAFAADSQYEKAAECGVQTSALYYRENFYKEAFDMLRSIDQLIAVCEQNEHKARPDLRYATVKERWRIYVRLNQEGRAQEQLERLEELAKASDTDSLRNDLLYVQASHNYTFGMNERGDAAVNRLIQQYRDAKQYDKVIDCCRRLIDIAGKSGNTALLSRSYEQYIAWKDSVRGLKAQDEVTLWKKACAEKQTIIDEKEGSLKERQYAIAGLCLLAGLLAAALIVGAVILVRFMALTRRQKRAIAVANENNEQKSRFIRRISSQLTPTLDRLDASLPAVKALYGFLARIEEMSELESHLSDTLEKQEKNVVTLCEGLVKQVEGKTKEGVTMVVNAPKLKVSVHPEMLERVLLHLLENAAFYTPAGGKITLEYKKRGAHTHQFIVSDTGGGIPTEKRETIFKPFSEVRDLTQGDGLGLPICALLAARMNGTLTLDDGYSKGARFILELHA